MATNNSNIDKQPVDGLFEALDEFLPGIMNGTVTGEDLAASAMLISRGSHAGSTLDIDLIRLATSEIDHIRATVPFEHGYRDHHAALHILGITQTEGEK